MNYVPYSIKQTFMVRMPQGEDLLAAVAAVVRETGVRLGVFSVIGAVSAAAFGYYDQKRRQYQTIIRPGAFEIVTGSGNVTLKDGSPFVHAHILFADETGNSFGGHLMSDTFIFAAELCLQELEGEPLVRQHDDTTGLFLWK
jgi:predicted DNA-binding protein with PD1-like motif